MQSDSLAKDKEPQVMSPHTTCGELSEDVPITNASASTSLDAQPGPLMKAQASAVSDPAENEGHSWQAPAMPAADPSLCLQQPSAEDIPSPWNVQVVNNNQGVKACCTSNEHPYNAFGFATPFCSSATKPSQNDASAITFGNFTTSPTTHDETLANAHASGRHDSVIQGEHASHPYPPVPVCE